MSWIDRDSDGEVKRVNAMLGELHLLAGRYRGDSELEDAIGKAQDGLIVLQQTLRARQPEVIRLERRHA